MKYVETRWALMLRNTTLLGVYCWESARRSRLGSDPTIRTFATRQQARASLKDCCYLRAIPVRVLVTVEVIR